MSEVDIVRNSLPNYEVGGELGRGGMGVVLAGRHVQLGRSVAIKELPPVLARDPKVRARFLAEARVLAALDHPHIVPIYDFVEHDGVCLLVMESLPGGTVWSRFTTAGFTPEQASATSMITCAALHYAHQHDVLHRDVKPENLLFSGSGQLKVTDFGIAKVIGGGETLATSAGDILGTPAYMAPEQAEGKELGPPADVFATGVMLYELLAGRLPYSEEGGALSIVYRHVYEDAVPILEVAPHVPPAVAAVVMRSLARRPEDRYQTAEEMGVALGAAATAAWGDGWLTRSGVQIMSAGPITVAAERPTVPDPSATGPQASVAAMGDTGRSTIIGTGPPPLPPTGPSTGPTGPLTPDPGSPAAPPGGSVAAPLPSVPQAPPSVAVRPSVSVHVPGARPVDLEGEELVPVRTVLEPPPTPVALGLAAAALLAATVVVGFVGLGDATDADLRPGTAFVAGVDVAEGAVPVDFGEQLEVAVDAAAVPETGAARIRLGLSAAGVPLIDSSTETLALQADGRAGAVLDVSGNRYLAAGDLLGNLDLLGAEGDVVATQEFVVEPVGSRLVTIPALLAGVLFLVVLAYAESALRPMRRRGRRGAVGVMSLAIVGAAFGVVAGLAGWILASGLLALTTVGAAAGLGALGGIALAGTAVRVGRRRRLRRAEARQAASQIAARPTQ